MTEEQKAFLTGRIEEAAAVQPEVKTLRRELLKLGGLELVPPGKPDLELAGLLSSGRLIEGIVVVEQMDEGYCHENVSELWLEHSHTITAIGTGYALSDDGLWRQHSWGIREDRIIETTSERGKYFGRILTAAEADEFAKANLGDPKERRWRLLPDVWFRLEKDEEGYPPKDWEGLRSEPTGEPNIYRILCTPFFARDIAYHDEVIAEKPEDGDYLVFKSVSKRSGYSLIRLWLAEGENSAAVMDALTEQNCLVESASNFAHRLIAVAIPPAIFKSVDEYISSQRSAGRWGVEDGYVAPS